jgi:hypothetical protein
VSTDPRTLADALDEVRNSLMGEWWFDEAEATEATGIIFAALTAAGYEVVPAGTAERLASELARSNGMARWGCPACPPGDDAEVMGDTAMVCIRCSTRYYYSKEDNDV